MADTNAIINALMAQRQQVAPGGMPQPMTQLSPMGDQSAIAPGGNLSSLPEVPKEQQGNGMLAGIMDKIFAAQMSQQSGNQIQGGMF